jgi:hypothetical protein
MIRCLQPPMPQNVCCGRVCVVVCCPAVLPNTAWMPFPASKDVKTDAGQRAEVCRASHRRIHLRLRSSSKNGTRSSTRDATAGGITAAASPPARHRQKQPSLTARTAEQIRGGLCMPCVGRHPVLCMTALCLRRFLGTLGCVTLRVLTSWPHSRAPTPLWHPMPR